MSILNVEHFLSAHSLLQMLKFLASYFAYVPLSMSKVQILQNGISAFCLNLRFMIHCSLKVQMTFLFEGPAIEILPPMPAKVTM